MNMKWIAASVLTLGATAFVPSFAQAGRIENRGRAPEREHRVEQVERRAPVERVVRDERFHDAPRFEDRHVVERRFEDRHVIIRDEPIVTPVYVTVAGTSVPQFVIDAANANCDGRSITSIQRGYTNGVDCYVIRECAPGRPDLNLSIGLGGQVLSISQVG